MPDCVTVTVFAAQTADVGAGVGVGADVGTELVNANVKSPKPPHSSETLSSAPV